MAKLTLVNIAYFSILKLLIEIVSGGVVFAEFSMDSMVKMDTIYKSYYYQQIKAILQHGHNVDA